LRNGESQLDVLGSGHQLKTFIHVEDVVSALSDIKIDSDFGVYNLSRADYSSVRDSVQWLSEVLQRELNINYGTTLAGWKGDNPRLFLDTEKISTTGWTPQHSIEKAVKDTVIWLIENQWVYEAKK
jgi:UDP-glucose 4-epimerase